MHTHTYQWREQNLKTQDTTLFETKNKSQTDDDDEEEEDFCIDQVHCVRAHPLWGDLSRRGLNPIKLAYNPSQPNGRLH